MLATVLGRNGWLGRMGRGPPFADGHELVAAGRALAKDGRQGLGGGAANGMQQDDRTGVQVGHHRVHHLRRRASGLPVLWVHVPPDGIKLEAGGLGHDTRVARALRRANQAIRASGIAIFKAATELAMSV